MSLAAAGIEAGAGVSTGRKAAAESELEVQEECAFAYRVREFQYSRFRRGIKTVGDVIEGALFDGDGGRREVPLTSEEADAKYDEVPVFDGFESEDEEIDSMDGVNINIVG